MAQEKDTAKEIIRFLDEGIAMLDARIIGKLIEARHRAVAALTRQQSAQVKEGSDSILHPFNDYIHNHRAMTSTALVCSAVFVAFLVTQQFSRQDNLEQGDGFLLASDLPPEAYLDKGFDVWLERSSRH